MAWARPSPSNWWLWENLDNAQTGIHDYFMWLKYGFGRGCQQISVDVRTGRIHRDDALIWLKHSGEHILGEYLGESPMSLLTALGAWDSFADVRSRFTNRDIHPCSPSA